MSWAIAVRLTGGADVFPSSASLGRKGDAVDQEVELSKLLFQRGKELVDLSVVAHVARKDEGIVKLFRQRADVLSNLSP